MNYRMIIYILGMLLMFQAAFFTIPSLTAAIYGESVLWAYLTVAAGCLLCGFLITRWKPKKKNLYARDGFVIVALSWMLLSVTGALPFVMTGEIPHYLDALFESVSGYTTTGASILPEVETLSHATLIWRSFTHWIGGMGVLVFIMAFLPLSGAQNMHIMKAESTGPSVGKLVPRVRTTAFLLYTIYFALTVLQLILLLFGDITLFEAINIAFSTAGTGGFGFRNDSFASFSPYIQIVTMVFMLLFSVNFNSYYLLLRGKWKESLTAEVKTFFIVVIIAIGIITWNIHDLFPTVGEALRHAAFTVASLTSSTGFATTDYDQWHEISKTLLLLMMFIGACAGSTGGGFKVSRILILVKSWLRQTKNALHPKQVKPIAIDGHIIGQDVVHSVHSYLVCYIGIFIVSCLLLTFDDTDLVTTFSAVSAMLNNTGPGFEMVGPTQNYAFFSNFSKLIMIFDMLAGRLELLPMLLLFTPSTWKK